MLVCKCLCASVNMYDSCCMGLCVGGKGLRGSVIMCDSCMGLDGCLNHSVGL